MNGERGDTEERTVNLDELGGEASVLVHNNDASGKRQVTIEPRVPDSASIGLDAYLEVAELGLLGDWPNLDTKFELSWYDTRTRGRTRKLGLSMCVATMDSPAPGFHFCGRVNATSALWFLDTAVRSTGIPSFVYSPREVIFSAGLQYTFPVICFSDLHPSLSFKHIDGGLIHTLRKPACSNLTEAVRTAWKGVGDALMKLMSLVAASGPACGIIISCWWGSWAEPSCAHFVLVRSLLGRSVAAISPRASVPISGRHQKFDHIGRSLAQRPSPGASGAHYTRSASPLLLWCKATSNMARQRCAHTQNNNARVA